MYKESLSSKIGMTIMSLTIVIMLIVPSFIFQNIWGIIIAIIVFFLNLASVYFILKNCNNENIYLRSQNKKLQCENTRLQIIVDEFKEKINE